MGEHGWLIYFSEQVRQRIRFATDGPEVNAFTVQLELLRGKSWIPMIRYDGTHGFTHCDRFRIDGERRKESLGLDFSDALTYAIVEIQAGWEDHLRRFEEGEFA